VSGQPGVPVAELDGEIVVDSLAIMRRLERLAPEPALWPADERERAQIELFLEWFRRAWMHALGTIYVELEKAGAIFVDRGDDRDDAKIERAGKHLAAHVELFESLLAGSDYLVGDALTVADLAAFPFLKYATDRTPADDYPIHDALRRLQSIDGHPRLAAWLERIDALPRA
jgi:glutathione S-transferase